MKRVKPEAAITTGVGEGPVVPQQAPAPEPTIFDKLDSFKKELDSVADLCRGGRWARAIRNMKDMQKDLGALAKEIQVEYLEDIED